jgi:hypothetical protein
MHVAMMDLFELWWLIIDYIYFLHFNANHCINYLKNKILTICSSGNPSLVFTTNFHYKNALYIFLMLILIDLVIFLYRMFEISHVMPIIQLIVFLHFEMYHKICVNMFYPMFTHVWNFTYNTTYIFNCLSPYWKVPYSCK